MQKMIQEIHSFDEYEGFIRELAAHPLYSDPHFTYDKDNLYRSLTAKDKYAFVVLENGTTEGLFVWIILPEDRYIEMLIGFTGKEEAFTEMLSYMERNYGGYQMDFVFNPQNTAISRPLQRKGASFDPEQQKMLLTGPAPNVSTSQIELLSEKWTKQYCDLHNVDTYWTAERILSTQDRFRVLLAVTDGQVQGYLDVQSCYEINEIYDLFIKPEAAQQGYEMALLAKAIELNRPHQMMVVVDVDAKAEIEFYTAAGFHRMEGQNSITASYQAKTIQILEGVSKLQYHRTTESEKHEICKRKYEGEYSIYDSTPYEEQRKSGKGFANPRNNFFSFYDGEKLVGYHYPQYDDTQITAKVPSQELSDAMVKAFKGKIKE